MESRQNGKSKKWKVGKLESRRIGKSANWKVGILENRQIGESFGNWKVERWESPEIDQVVGWLVVLTVYLVAFAAVGAADASALVVAEAALTVTTASASWAICLFAHMVHLSPPLDLQLLVTCLYAQLGIREIVGIASLKVSGDLWAAVVVMDCG